MKNHKLVSRRDAIKLGAGAATAAAALSLVGCGGSSDGGSDAASGEAKDSYKVALVISGPVLDGGWGQGHYESLQKACPRRTPPPPMPLRPPSPTSTRTSTSSSPRATSSAPTGPRSSPRPPSLTPTCTSS